MYKISFRGTGHETDKLPRMEYCEGILHMEYWNTVKEYCKKIANRYGNQTAWVFVKQF